MMWRPSFEALLTSSFVLAGVLWGGVLGTRQMVGLDSGLDRAEYLTLDWRFLLAGERPAPRGVVIAAIDDETLREVGSYPVPRDKLAQIVRKLATYAPQAIAVDMLFVDPGKANSDAILAEALRGTPSIVGAVGVFNNEGSHSGKRSELKSADLVPAPTTVLWPIPIIRDATQTGLVNLSTDNTGVPRFIPMLFRVGDMLAPSFVLAASSTALHTEPVFGTNLVRLAARTAPLDLGYHLPLRYYGPRGSIRQFSIARILRGDLDPDLVRAQVVVIGATALGTGDIFATPFDRTFPGVEVLATAVSNLLAGDGLIRSNSVRTMDAATSVALPAILVLLLGFRRAMLGVGLACIVLVGWIAAVYAAFLAGYWLSIAVPLSSALPIGVTYALVRLVADRASARRLSDEKQALAKFQSPFLLKHILANPQFLEKPVRKDIPVVFLDLSNFTSVAEALGPEWARELLADFQARIEHIIVAKQGYVTSFMGDGAMIIFGLPTIQADDASRALHAIIQLRDSITAWLNTLPPAAKDRLSVRIGGHFGPVMLCRTRCRRPSTCHRYRRYG